MTTSLQRVLLHAAFWTVAAISLAACLQAYQSPALALILMSTGRTCF